MVLKEVSFFGSILNGLERTLFMEFLWLYGLITAGFRFTFDIFGRWSWKDTFTWLFISMEVTSFRMVLKGVCWWFRFASSVFSMGFCHLSVLDGLERSSSCCFSVIFSITKTDFEMFLHKTHIRPNLMLAGWPTMIGFGVFVSTT